jgi:hypothetical protein
MGTTKLPKVRSKTYRAELLTACPPLLKTNVTKAQDLIRWESLTDEQKKATDDSNTMKLHMPGVLTGGDVQFQTVNVSHVIISVQLTIVFSHCFLYLG